jgi:hypothetical protein
MRLWYGFTSKIIVPHRRPARRTLRYHVALPSVSIISTVVNPVKWFAVAGSYVSIGRLAIGGLGCDTLVFSMTGTIFVHFPISTILDFSIFKIIPAVPTTPSEAPQSVPRGLCPFPDLLRGVRLCVL